MHQKIEFKNHTSSFWTYLTIFSLIITGIFCFIWWYITPPFLIGIFRFGAFIGLIGFIFGFLHTREKTKCMEMSFTKDQLCINYFVGSKKEQEEFFDCHTIYNIIKAQAPPIWGFITRKESIKFTISFTDTDNKLSLFRFGGQDLFVADDDAQKIHPFLKTHLKDGV